MQTSDQISLHTRTNQYPDSGSRKYDADISAGHRIITTSLAGYQGPVAMQLWDGSMFNCNKETQCVLHVRHPGVFRDLILHRDIVKLAEAYIAGDIDVTGDLEIIFSLESHLNNIPHDYRIYLRLLLDALRLPTSIKHPHNNNVTVNSKKLENSPTTIAHHYDVSNDFYKLWLDPHMIYSCAYFMDTQQSLAHAQCDKLNHICRKLRLQPGQRLLDIGCGWGALVMWAAKYYGAICHGITLSQQQYRYALQHIHEQGLQQQVTVELRDYRDMNANTLYDRITSIGMFEHVGVDNFPQYFNVIKRLLKPGGLFLNHGITSINGQHESPLKRFMNKYIFPDGELARISDVSDAMENSGFEIIDIESMRRHYALTLRQWIKALDTNMNQAIQLTSVETYRLWRLYMSGCAYYFDEGTLNLHQILAGHQQNDLPLPLRREE